VTKYEAVLVLCNIYDFRNGVKFLDLAPYNIICEYECFEGIPSPVFRLAGNSEQMWLDSVL